jgi:hypothetical protein
LSAVIVPNGNAAPPNDVCGESTEDEDIAGLKELVGVEGSVCGICGTVVWAIALSGSAFKLREPSENAELLIEAPLAPGSENANVVEAEGTWGTALLPISLVGMTTLPELESNAFEEAMLANGEDEVIAGALNGTVKAVEVLITGKF